MYIICVYKLDNGKQNQNYALRIYIKVKANMNGANGRGYTEEQQEEYARHLHKWTQEFFEAWGQKTESTAQLDNFEKRAVLGTGAFGVVWLTKHVDTGKYYAMKMLEKEQIVKQKQIDHTFNEKRVLGSINFPFVVYMRYFFKDNVYLYFVLPFIPGGELFTVLRKMKKFEESSSKFYGAQVVLAFEYLHACKLIYRDLKPENILLDRAGYIKLTDFGFAKQLTDRTWTLCGTPEYIAPEIILSKGYSQAVDWWAFGILLFEMTAGHPPFYGTDPIRIYEKVLAGKYRFPSHFSAELKDLVSHILQFDTSRRFGNLKRGILDFKCHSWFEEIHWNALFNGRIAAPYIPKIHSPGDISNFDTYEIQKILESSVCLFEEEFEHF